MIDYDVWWFLNVLHIICDILMFLFKLLICWPAMVDYQRVVRASPTHKKEDNGSRTVGGMSMAADQWNWKIPPSGAITAAWNPIFSCADDSSYVDIQEHNDFPLPCLINPVPLVFNMNRSITSNKDFIFEGNFIWYWRIYWPIRISEWLQ